MDRVGGGRNNFVTGSATTRHQTADSSSWQLDDDREHEILDAGSDISSSNPDDPYMYMAAAGEDFIMRRGPWTLEEDLLLVNYITKHGEGRWNSLAQSSGLKRTGKSCRLRWLNYLRPDVRRGNITPQEQLLILQLHSRWGNRWSKIAQYLPGRTDNEIKNYWRTRVQKQAKQLRCDVNSKLFKDTMRYIWMPRLAERIQAAQASSFVDTVAADDNQQAVVLKNREGVNSSSSSSPAASSSCYTPESTSNSTITTTDHTTKTTNTVAAAPASSDSFGSSTSTSAAPKGYYMNNYSALDHYDHGHDQLINTQNTQFMISSSPSSAAAAAAGNYFVNSNMPYNNNIGPAAAGLELVDHQHLQNHNTSSNNTTQDDWLVDDEDSWDINLWSPELLEDSISWFSSSLHQQF